MKTFFSRILVAQVIAVVLALLIVTVITRISLDRGFRVFLKAQETTVLETVAPVLADVYETQGNWSTLLDQPENWQRVWRSTRGPQENRSGRGPRPHPPGNNRPPPPGQGVSTDLQALRWMRPSDRGMLRERLFLLDGQFQRVAGATPETVEELDLQAINLGGKAVGWIGFSPAGRAFPPEAERFFRGQVRITVIALAIALVVATALALLLARNLSRPVKALDNTVRRLSEGEYDARAELYSLDETGRLAEHINLLAASLEKNRTARRRWMADIAHELRTPVAILKGEIEALSDGVRAADDRMTASLQEEIEQLSVLIDDLQTLALSDAGALNIHKEKIRLDTLIQQCTEAYRDRMARRRIDLHVSVQALEATIDPQRTRQLLANLLENSCRYVDEGGTVTLDLKETDDGCELLIEDSGPGLSKSQLSRLFERFYRAEESRTRSGGGAGLGLSICRNIVEAHGGRIFAEQAAAGGLRIRIELPV
ncbi:ATP-binding protein [Pseudomonadota bacterium]